MAISQRTLYGIQGGLSAPDGQGFLGGLMSGLSGTLGGFSKYTDTTQEQERQRIRDMVEERRLRLAEESLALRRAQTPRPASAPEDYTVPFTNAEGDTERSLPPYLQGVPTPLMKTAATQFFQQKFAPPQRPDPFATWLKKEEYKQANPQAQKLGASEREMVQLINSMDPMNPEHKKRLEAIVKNPPFQEAAYAAEKKIRSGMNWSPQ